MSTATATPTRPRFVRAITCTRCTGTGYVESRVAYCGVPGTCFKCDGHGEVEGDAATIRAIKAAHKARCDAGRRVHRDDLGYGVLTGAPCAEIRNARIFRDAAAQGLAMLEANEPDRLARAVASINAGHPGVFVALATYAVTNGYRAMLDHPVVAPDGTTIGA